jgi:glucan phosphoethanolaminetransferase (alkaline phosphatase superfamily)
MRHYPGRLLAAIALLSSPYVFTAFWLGSHRGWPACAIYLSIALGGVLLLAVVARRARCFLLLHFPAFTVCSVIAGYTIVCEQLPGYPIAMVLETSSWEEVRGFFDLWQGQKWLLLFLGAALCYLLLSFSIPSSARLHDRSSLIRRTFMGCLALMAAGTAAAPEQLGESFAASPIVGTAMFVAGPLSSADYTIHGPIKRKRPYGAARVRGDEVHILVIGESSRRNSWSVYGYSRATTPYLSSTKSELILFTNAISDANTTIYAVPIMLTGISPESFTFVAPRGSIVDLANEAGYFSIWLVNNDPGPSSLVAVEPDASKYTVSPKPRVMEYFVFPPDEVLLPEFERQVVRRGTALFIGLHLYGSHNPYAKRYPGAFARFDASPRAGGGAAESKLVNSYDDSIFYTDWVLGRVIERARKLEVPATVTYLSDHGEDLQELDGRSGHGAGDYSPHAFEIPAFVWVNQAYRHAHPEKVAALVANASKEVRTHDFFFSLADLMGIRWPGFLPQRSFASSSFVPDTAEKHIAGGVLVARPGN